LFARDGATTNSQSCKIAPPSAEMRQKLQLRSLPLISIKALAAMSFFELQHLCTREFVVDRPEEDIPCG
jgi:hypothetical protein